MKGPSLHHLSVVIPVYQGADTLPGVIEELLPWASPSATPKGRGFTIDEILLVHDNGPDASDETMRALAAQHEGLVRPVWLSRNYGQHAATLAGMASSGGDWIVTMDEDGQHDPAYIGAMLDTALDARAAVVYGDPVNEAPHGALRNMASISAKKLMAAASGLTRASDFQSYRLVLGTIGRSVAAYAGHGVYLDVALGWVTKDVATCPVELREEGGRPSGYNFRSLFGHFWRMLLTSGTRGLRAVSIIGGLAACLGVFVALWFVVKRLVSNDPTPSGWASLIVAVLIMGGLTLTALGIIAEYIGVNVNMAMGKPLYLIVPDLARGPLGRAEADTDALPSTDGAVPASHGRDTVVTPREGSTPTST